MGKIDSDYHSIIITITYSIPGPGHTCNAGERPNWTRMPGERANTCPLLDDSQSWLADRHGERRDDVSTPAFAAFHCYAGALRAAVHGATSAAHSGHLSRHNNPEVSNGCGGGSECTERAGCAQDSSFLLLWWPPRGMRIREAGRAASARGRVPPARAALRSRHPGTLLIPGRPTATTTI